MTNIDKNQKFKSLEERVKEYEELLSKNQEENDSKNNIYVSTEWHVGQAVGKEVAD